jgi:lysyl endopeptidase
MRRFYLTIVLLSLVHAVFAQEVLTQLVTNQKVVARSTSSALKFVPSALKMKKVDTAALLEEDKKEAGQNVPPRFGKALKLSLDLANAGSWQTVEGGRIWQFALTSPGALSLSFLFDKFSLPPNAELYLYNSDRSIVMGPITAAQNNKAGIYATDLVKGDLATLELFEPTTAEGESVLHISRVVHGYKNMFGSTTYDAGFGQSATCNVDVSCPAGNGWQLESNSVAMILLSNGERYCSGSMLADACQDLTPNFLTAFHCVDQAQDGFLSQAERDATQSWVFRFNYKSQTCRGGDSYNYASLSGAELVAAFFNTDFALMRLNSTPSANSGIVYAGWNRTSTAATSTASLHHPNGDVMKIATSDQAPQIVSFPSTNFQPSRGANTHWRANFNVGTVQHGSSGAPLFDQNHYVVGQLTGDQNNHEDYCAQHVGEYGRFDLSWDGGGTPDTRLQDWLTNDPSVTAVNTLSLSGPDIVCQASTFQTYATNVQWTASPANLFTTLSGSGSQFTTSGAPGQQGTGTITATFGAACGQARSMTKTVRVGTEPSGYYYAGSASGNLATYQYVGQGQVSLFMNEPYNFTFSSNNSSVNLSNTSGRNTSFYLGPNSGVAITALRVQLRAEPG